jgi:hypothetical protein
MSKEVPLQFDMFSGELVDTRTSQQKLRAMQQEQPRQIEMFSQRELAQFGVKANPKLSLSVKTRLELVMKDPRSEEEIARDLQREIEGRTYPMPGIREDLTDTP